MTARTDPKTHAARVEARNRECALVKVASDDRRQAKSIEKKSKSAKRRRADSVASATLEIVLPTTLVEVTFGVGPLGIEVEPAPAGSEYAVVVGRLGVAPPAGVAAGDVVMALAGATCHGRPYGEVVDTLSVAPRPLVVSFGRTKPIAGFLITADDELGRLDFLGVFKLDTAHPEVNGRPHYSSASGWHLLYSAEELRMPKFDWRIERPESVQHGWLLQATFCPDSSTSHRAFFATDLGVPLGDQRWYISYDRAYKALEPYGCGRQICNHCSHCSQRHCTGHHHLTVVELQSLVEVLAAEQTSAETAMAVKEEAFAQARRVHGLQITMVKMVSGIRMQISEEGMGINASRICGRQHWPLVKGVFALNQPFQQDVKCPEINGWPHYSTVAGAHLYRSLGGRWVLSTGGFATAGGLVQWNPAGTWASERVVGGAVASESDRIQRIGRDDVAEDVSMPAGTCIVASFGARQVGAVPQGERPWLQYVAFLPILGDTVVRHSPLAAGSARQSDYYPDTELGVAEKHFDRDRDALLIEVTELAQPKMDELSSIFRALEEGTSIRAATAWQQHASTPGFRIAGLHHRSDGEGVVESWEEPLRGVFVLDPDLPKYNGRPHYSTAAGGHLFFDWRAWRLSIATSALHWRSQIQMPRRNRRRKRNGFLWRKERYRARHRSPLGHWSEQRAELYHFSEDPEEVRVDPSDGNSYTELEFFDRYSEPGSRSLCGGLKMWTLAERAGTVEVPASGVGSVPVGEAVWHRTGVLRGNARTPVMQRIEPKPQRLTITELLDGDAVVESRSAEQAALPLPEWQANECGLGVISDCFIPRGNQSAREVDEKTTNAPHYSGKWVPPME
ncbi:MAG: hypothetical protein OSB10_05735, partial [Planctomycetota bacterium]|nr:hypothetical protein [Planctomycetota bacterium]